jgi:uncharacterized protein (TIGR03067 family)
VKAERKALTGTWNCGSSEVYGVKRRAKECKDQTLTFEGEKFAQADDATGDVIEGTYQLDLTGKQKVLSTNVTVGTKEVTIRYIYERGGENLKVCADLRPQAELPAEFSAPDGSRRMVAAFKRAKK